MTGHHHDGAPAVEALAVPAGPASLDLLPLLAEALAGDRPVMPHAASGPVPPVPDHDPTSLPEALAVVIGTSGSTGSPKRAMLTAPALRASARATHATLGGPGQWLLAIPAHHIAGLQVLVRSLDAGTPPPRDGPHRRLPPRGVRRSHRTVGPGRPPVHQPRAPTQVIRLLDHPGGADALRTFDAVLVGGAAMPPRLRARAERARVHLVATYGMSETAGGCVYDGRALPRTEVELDEEARILLGGPTIAHGYLGLPALTRETFGTDEDGIRWFRTDDVGHVDDDGTLHVDGRVDDLIITGGLKVAPRLVEEAILEHVPGIREVVVVGSPDHEWGACVSALVVLSPDAVHDVTAADLRAHLRGILPDHALPRRALTSPAIPTRGPGKPDRRAVEAMFTVG
jgi:O-succinylbenzoic acid--CoA ligase